MTRAPAYSVIALLVLGVLFAHVSLSGMQNMIVCASTDDAFRIPSPVCMHYLRNATDSGDAARLDEGPGLAYVFSIPDGGTRRTIMTRLLEIGVGIDTPSGIDGLTPLHAAILLNDPQLVGFLIEHGADASVRNATNQLDARGYLEFLRERDGGTDRSAIAALLDQGGLQE